MNKAVTIKINNIALLLSMALEAATGIMLFLRLFISQPKIFRAVIEIHEYNGLFLIALVFIHIILYRGWFRTLFSNSAKR